VTWLYVRVSKSAVVVVIITIPITIKIITVVAIVCTGFCLPYVSKHLKQLAVNFAALPGIYTTLVVALAMSSRNKRSPDDLKSTH
jgi:ABC-type Fe3+ transport system substrate-binding protein